MPTPAPVVLDVDGTLVDSNYQHALAWHRAFAQLGLTVPAWRTHRAIGMGGDTLVEALAGKDWDAEHGDAARDAERVLFTEQRDAVTPLPSARDFLVHVHERGHPVVLSSSAKADELDHYLELLDARDLVDAWTTSGDVEQTKPAPDLVEVALERLGSPDGAVMVGDSVYDVEAAKRAGLGTVALRTGGFGADELAEAGAVAIYDDLTALLERFKASPLA